MATNYESNLAEFESLLHETSSNIRSLKTQMDTPEIQNLYQQVSSSETGAQLIDNLASRLAENGYLGTDGKLNTQGHLNMIGISPDVAEGLVEACEVPMPTSDISSFVAGVLEDPDPTTTDYVPTSDILSFVAGGVLEDPDPTITDHVPTQEVLKQLQVFEQTMASENNSVTLNEYISTNTPASSENITAADYATYSELSYAAKYYDSQGYLDATQKTGISVKEYAAGLLNEMPESNPYNAAENPQAYEEWNSKYGTTEYRNNREFLKTLSTSDRYANVTVDGVEYLTAGENRTNIVVVGYGDGKGVMSVQGTDKTVADWDQNTNLGVRETEIWGAEKFNKYAENYTSIDLNGHSQGGHEAVTIGVLADDSAKEKIGVIVSLDGNGHTKEFLEQYADEIAKIKGKVVQIKPSKTVVGGLEHGINDENAIYVETDGEGIFDMTNIHPATKWHYSSDGSLIQTKQSVESIIIETAMDYLVDNVSEEQAEQLGRTLFEGYFYDQDNPEQIQFSRKSIEQTLVRLAGMNEEDILNLESIIFTTIGNVLTSDTVADMIDKIADCVIPYLSKVAGKAAGKSVEAGLMVVFGEIPGFGVLIAKVGGYLVEKIVTFIAEIGLEGVAELFKKAVKELGEFFKSIGEYYNELRRQITARKTEQREAYIAANPAICVDGDVLEAVAQLMVDATNNLNAANDALHQMTLCFMQEITEKVEELLGEEIITKWVTKIVYKGLSDAVDYVRKNWGLRLEDLDKRADMEKIRRACLRIEAAAEDVMQGTETNLIESSFTVEPAAVTQCCTRLTEIADALSKQKDQFKTRMDQTASYWQGDDQDAFAQNVQKLVEASDIQIQNILVRVAQVTDAMQRYQQFQDSAVQICQNNT